METVILSNRSPFKFFVLIFILAVPIWLLSIILGNISTLKIPITDLMLAFSPMAAAAILVNKEEGLGGVKMLFKRIFDYERIRKKIWYLPLIYLLVVGVMRLTGNNAVADNHLLMIPLLFILFFILAAGEETGWMGYAIDPLQKKWGALKASILLAIPWWIGHFPSIIHIGGTITDLAWWLPGAIALRILIVWLYNNTGKSLFTAIFFHTMANIGRIILYPSTGSHYNQNYQAVGYIIVTIAALIVTLLWNTKTLTRETGLKKYLCSKFSMKRN